MGSLEGKVALVTGAGSGMGQACAELFAHEGANVLALDVSGREGDVADALGERALAAHCDVSKEEEVAAAFDLALSTWGRLDAVLNVAGISGTPTPLHELSVDAYEQVMSVNARGVLLGIKHGLRAMLAAGNGGAIVNWSSIGGTHAFPYAGAYCASKAAVIGLTRVAAADYAQEGIRVNAVCVGIADTPMNQNILTVMPDLPTRPPIGRAATPQEVAEVAAYLCSDRARYVSGAILPVDGAWSVKVAI
jgi:NAD(P)-dependent dehydrogenase (short-subunit alcohol dehydrogenase family)